MFHCDGPLITMVSTREGEKKLLATVLFTAQDHTGWKAFHSFFSAIISFPQDVFFSMIVESVFYIHQVKFAPGATLAECVALGQEQFQPLVSFSGGLFLPETSILPRGLALGLVIQRAQTWGNASCQGLAAACEPCLQAGKTRHFWALWESKLHTDITLCLNESLNGKFRSRCCSGKVKSSSSRRFGRSLSSSMEAEPQLHYSVVTFHSSHYKISLG